MSVLRRKELEDSPLADLHAIASELGVEGFRAKRKDDLVAAILDAQGGEGENGAATEAGLADDETGDDADVTGAGLAGEEEEDEEEEEEEDEPPTDEPEPSAEEEPE